MIYLDNAATTWPKPEETIAAVVNCMRRAGANPGRGGHKMSLEAGRIIFETREALAKMFGVSDPARIVFTGNATESLNIALKGFLKPGDHVITSSMEHNAVARPLQVLKAKGIQITEVSCSPQGELDPRDVDRAVKTNTAAVIIMHASNVTGTIMPIGEIGKITRQKGLCFIVDAAQTAGLLDIDVDKMNIDLLAFTGHKSLYGPQGTGGLFIRDETGLEPLKQGGTGSSSESPEQPEEMPDKFESGTPNTPGIAGLRAGIKFISGQGIDSIRKHENELLSKFLAGLKQIKKIEIYGTANPLLQVPVVSLNVKGQDSAEIAFIMDKVFDIACRSGLHCSPSAHRTIGTLGRGTVRFSFSLFNTAEEVDLTLEALERTITELP
ncbi:MAG: aminotransferase class V-fold PLP-dependent enzyme [Eubacteriales bacterium]